MVDYSKAIFENSNDAMLVHNSDTTILDANNAAGELLGYRREDLIGLRIADFFRNPSTNVRAQQSRTDDPGPHDL